MPLTLRRRPRIATLVPDADAELAQAADPVAPPAPEVPPAAPSTSTARRRRSRARTTDWLDRVLGEGFFFLVGLTAWVINAIFTVLGVTALLGLSPGSVLVGLIVHLGISRAELHLWHRWRDPWYLALLTACVLIDVGTTLVGIVALIAVRWPALLGAAPPDVLQWHSIITSLIAGGALPPWTLNVLGMLALASGLALGSERLMRKFWRGLAETWDERMAAS